MGFKSRNICDEEVYLKVVHLYEIRTLDGARYRGEMAYRDNDKVVLRMRQKSPEQKLRILKSGISSIKDIGWQKAYALRP